MSAQTVSVRRPSEVRLSVLPPLALYVHIPWCVRKCPYCDFNSHERGGELPQAEYIEALVADLEGLLPSVWGRRVSSVFIGGGTPSLFSVGAIERLLSEVRARVVIEPDAEITLEANPGTAEAGRFRGYRAAGVNRLSIGVQSFDDAMLRRLGRIHDGSEARNALKMARSAFDNVNLDLMYGLPGQTQAMAQADITEALRWETTHLSAYQLTIEPNTAFYSQPPQLPEHDVCADMQRAAEEALFARPGRRCRHNLNYWQFGDYLGIGAGAHGKISFADRITRHARIKQPRDYLAAARAGGSMVEDRTIDAKDLPFEFMLNALRLVEGFDAELYPARTGLPITTVAGPLAAAEASGLIERSSTRIRPTERGRLFLNALVERFLPER